MIPNYLLKEKVEVVTEPSFFLTEWNDKQFKKVNRTLMKLFKGHVLTDHRGRKILITTQSVLDNFFGLPYTSSSGFAMLSNTNTLYYVDADNKYNLEYVALDKNENVYLVAYDKDENAIYLKVR